MAWCSRFGDDYVANLVGFHLKIVGFREIQQILADFLFLL